MALMTEFGEYPSRRRADLRPTDVGLTQAVPATTTTQTTEPDQSFTDG